MAFLRNAEIAAEGQLPICQDTGTATIVGKKGQQVWTGVKDEEWLSKGVYQTYREGEPALLADRRARHVQEGEHRHETCLRRSTSTRRGREYKFLFVTKGGGSANKTMLWQETKALLTPEKLEKFVVDKMKYLAPRLPALPHRGGGGRHLGGGVPQDGEARLTKYYDGLPTKGTSTASPSETWKLEQRLLEAATSSASARSSAEVLRPRRASGCAYRATAPPARVGMGSPAPPTGT